MAVDKERLEAATRNSAGGERRAKRRMRLLVAELRKVSSSSVMLGLWLGDGKVGSQVIGEDQNQLPGRETVGEVSERIKKSQQQNKRESTQI